jgi:hypothetical protein
LKGEDEESKQQTVLPELPVTIYSDIMKFMSLRDILCQLMVLNSEIRQEIMSQNYILFKKFIKTYTLSKCMEKSDMLVTHNVFDLIRSNMQLSLKSVPEIIQPFVFYTDGGVCSDEFFYSIH